MIHHPTPQIKPERLPCRGEAMFLWVPRHPPTFRKSLLEADFHHDYRLNFHNYKREAPSSNLLWLRPCCHAMRQGSKTPGPHLPRVHSDASHT